MLSSITITIVLLASGVLSHHDHGENLEARMVAPNPLNSAAPATLWSGSPAYNDVVVGDSGDCWLGAVMASVAYVDADVIKNLMVNLDNQGKNSDRIAVSLWDGQAQEERTFTVPLSAAVATDMPISAAVVEPGPKFVWPIMMALAFEQLAQANSQLRIPTDLTTSLAVNAFRAIDGDGGETTETPLVGLPDDGLWALLGPVKTKSTTVLSRIPDNGNYVTPMWVPGNHSFTIMDSDQNGQTVTLWNPWGIIAQSGVGEPSDGNTGVTDHGNGLFTISIADFKDNFVYIQQNGPRTDSDGTPPAAPTAATPTP